MTAPPIIFENKSAQAEEAARSLSDLPGHQQPDSTQSAFPKQVILELPEERMVELEAWLNQWMMELTSAHQDKLDQWAQEERDYRAKSLGPQKLPYEGACGDVVPAIAMAVDPIHARLDTGIFKADPVYSIKALKKSLVGKVASLEKFINYYQEHKLRLRQIASPRILECTKHGTMVYKVVYDQEKTRVKTYDTAWKVIDKDVVRFRGPRVFGVSLNDFVFPAHFQHIQDCPIVAERLKVYGSDLDIAVSSNKLDKTQVDAVKTNTVNTRTILEDERAESANHREATPWLARRVELWEIWCKFDVDGDGSPERLLITYHIPTRRILQLRYNYYFHQKFPYVVVPYSITNDSIYGIGIAEMVKPFQDMLTRWQRMASDNAYLANIRMFIARKDSGIENAPTMFAGKVFKVDKPKEDFIPFQAAEIYTSTLSERQNLFGLSEKRTGVSDYLTGRESPIVGSRATATSTMALIQEGTRRVEEVLENFRDGFSELMEMCLYIWMQFGLDGIDDIVFGDDQVATDVKDFFDSVGPENFHGALAINLSATDAAQNRSAQQQMQLAIIQTMMQYLEKLLEAGQQALMAPMQLGEAAPVYQAMVGDVITAARKMFSDLLQKYDIPNPDDYLPDLEKYLAATNGSNGAGGSPPIAGGTGESSGIPMPPATPAGPPRSSGAGIVGSIRPGQPGGAPG